MTKTQSANQVKRLAAMREGYPLDAAYAKEMARTLLETFAGVGEAHQCITDMIDGEKLPNPRAIKDWAREHGAQRPNGTAGGTGWRQADTECLKCEGVGFTACDGWHVGPGGEVVFEANAVTPCDCRKG